LRPPQRAFIPLDVPQTVVTFGGPASAATIEFHGGLCREPHPRRRVVRRGFTRRSARSGLAYSVYESLLWMDHSALFIGSTGTRADRTGNRRCREKESAASPRTARRLRNSDDGQVLSEGSQMLALDTSSKLASALLQLPARPVADRHIEKRNALGRRCDARRRQEAAQRLWARACSP